jgi:hypothetical protein
VSRNTRCSALLYRADRVVDHQVDEALHVVKEIAAGTLESGGAAVVVNEETTGGRTLVTFWLTPENPSARAVVVQPDHDARISLFPSRRASTRDA